ncbi:PAS domain-containing protein [Parafilimonas sp.]|uniref:PAS domain-containing protein n=1 Tax=Parafilimonas sp. TaxID=1969739 RepID=UPI0039E2956A
MDTSGFFETFFNNAKYNGIIIMDKQGIIHNINEAFHARFGYARADLAGKNFEVLFTEKDREILKPETELKTVLAQGSANDENYLVHKDGNKVWVTGESVYIENKDGYAFVVKVVHNIHAQKQLERFLIESHEFIDSVFDSIYESALIILDSRLRVVKANRAFLNLFELKEAPDKGSRLSEINNPFWQRADVKQETVNFLTLHNVSEAKIFELQTRSGITKEISFLAKLVEGVPGIDRKLLIMIKEIN